MLFPRVSADLDLSAIKARPISRRCAISFTETIVGGRTIYPGIDTWRASQRSLSAPRRKSAIPPSTGAVATAPITARAELRPRHQIIYATGLAGLPAPSARRRLGECARRRAAERVTSSAALFPAPPQTLADQTAPSCSTRLIGLWRSARAAPPSRPPCGQARATLASRTYWRTSRDRALCSTSRAQTRGTPGGDLSCFLSTARAFGHRPRALGAGNANPMCRHGLGRRRG